MLGAGGMGSVYAARDVLLDRVVAIKVLPVSHERDPERRGWLLREARAAAALSHPNVATVFEAGEDGGTAYVAMELVDGQTLAARLQTRRLSLAEISSIGAGIARGLESAHAVGVIHRDLKPANVVLADGDIPKLVDFGLARPPTRASAEERTSFEGVVAGTPGYMAPEQVRGEATDARTDLFALGAVLYEMWSGRAPFGDNPLAAMIMTLQDEPPAIDADRAGLPDELRALIARLMSKDAAGRPSSAREVAEALRRLGSPTEIAAPVGGLAPQPPEPARGVSPVAPTLQAAAVLLRPCDSQVGLVGRQDEVARVEDELLAFARLVTITGPPGIGKSATAVEIAGRARARGVRVTMLALGPMTSLDEAEAALALALRGNAAVAALEGLLALEDGLIFLDSGEALGAQLGVRLERWLSLSARARFVLSSRSQLGTASERVVLLGPLSPAAAREVFVARALAARPSLVLDAEQRASVDGIVRVLDGNPLALALAAARVVMLSPAQIEKRLTAESETRFSLLDGRAGTGSMSSLRDAIGWSFELLSPPVARIAARLSLFEAAFDVESAEQVAHLSREGGSGTHVLDALDTLRTASLLRSSTDSEGAVQLTMEPNIRAFARALLVDDPLRAEIVEAFVHCLGALAKSALMPSGRAYARAAEAGSSFRSAVRLALGTPGLVIPGLWAAVLLVVHRPERELETSLRTLLEQGAREGLLSGELMVRAELALYRAVANRDAHAALEVARSAVRRAEPAGDVELLAEARGLLVDGLIRCGRFDEADALAATMLDAARAVASVPGEVDALDRLGRLGWHRSAVEPALVPLRRALVLAEGLRDRPRQAYVLLSLGVLCVQGRRFAEARGLYERARELARAEHLGGVVAVVANNLGVIHHEEGRLEEAIASFEECRAEASAVARPLLVGIALGNRGMAEHELGRPAEARTSLDASIRTLQALGDLRFLAALLGARATLHADADLLSEAHRDLAAAGALLGQAHEPQLALALSIRAAHVEFVATSGLSPSAPEARAARAAAAAHLAELQQPDSVAVRSDLARMALRALARAVEKA